jgi:hypothetical protein
MPDDATPTNPQQPGDSVPAGGASPAQPATAAQTEGGGPTPSGTAPAGISQAGTTTPPPVTGGAADTLNFAANPDPNQIGGAQTTKAPEPPAQEKPYDPGRDREAARGDLARGLLWLLGFTVAGVLVFVALGRIDGSAVTQSIFPSLIALAGTALGFYFGTAKTNGQ